MTDANGVMQAVYDPVNQALRVSGSGGGGSGAPTTASYITTAAESGLSAEKVLGTDIIMRGLTADKPAAEIAGRIYIESDLLLRVFRDSGSAWFEIARNTGATVPASLFDANTILKADTDDTPVALPMGASTILARLAAGGIVAATPAQLKTLLTLAAADVSDFNTAVATTAILKSLVDAKGDVLAGTADNTVARLAVGTDGQVLTADAASTPGVKWATPSGGGAVATDAIFDAKGDLAVGTGADTAAKLTAGADGSLLVADATQSTGLRYTSARSYLLDEVHADVSVVNTTTPTNLYSFALPTTLVAGDVLRLRAAIEHLNSSGADVNYTFDLILGTTTIMTAGPGAFSTNANSYMVDFSVELFIASTTAQRAVASMISGRATAGALSVTAGSYPKAGYGTAAETITSAKNLILKVTMGTAHANASAVLHGASLMLAKK